VGKAGFQNGTNQNKRYGYEDPASYLLRLSEGLWHLPNFKLELKRSVKSREARPICLRNCGVGAER
jgi:hypothetical protein